jgi:phytoene dehydrogenase-like protein
MNRLGTSGPMEPDSSLGWRFPLRRVGFDEAWQLLRESVAPFQTAPFRLTWMFLLLWVAVQALVLVPTLGQFLIEMAAAAAFTGYTAALDAAARSEPPDLRHLAVVARFGRDKLILLMLTGLLPVLFAVLVLCGVWGLQETARFLDALGSPEGHPSPRLVWHFQAAKYVASMPFAFVAPVWALYRWSGSRSMAANLLASLVNWRWVLAMTGFEALASEALVWLQDQGGDFLALSAVGGVALDALTVSWTLALAKRSFPAR